MLYLSNSLLLCCLLLFVNSLEESKSHYIYKDNDILLFLTKDGYLNFYKKGNNNSNNWKIYLGDYKTFPNDINSNREQLCCQACGSLKVSPGTLIYLDDAKGVEIPYLCLNCGYVGSRAARIKNLVPADDGGQCLVVDLIPDGLVGIAGTLINKD